MPRRTEHRGRGWSAAIDIHHNQPVPGQPTQMADPASRARPGQSGGGAPSPISTWSRRRSLRDLPKRAIRQAFLRLAHIPFEAVADDGAKLALLRVEVEAVTDVGSLTPHLGGGSMRFDPLPARMVLAPQAAALHVFRRHDLAPRSTWRRWKALVPVRR